MKRYIFGVAALVMSLSLLQSSFAQQASTIMGQQQQNSQASSFWTGVNPRAINFQKIDTSKALAPVNTSSVFRAPRAPSTFQLSNVFPKISLGSWPPKTANAPILKPYSTPFQPNPLPGVNPFNPPPGTPVKVNSSGVLPQ